MARTRVVDHSCEEAERPHISGTSTAATRHTHKPTDAPLAAAIHLFYLTKISITAHEITTRTFLAVNKYSCVTWALGEGLWVSVIFVNNYFT